MTPWRIIDGRGGYVQPIAGFKLTSVKRNRRASFKERCSRRGHLDTLTARGSRAPRTLAPQLQRDGAHTVVIAGLYVDRHDPGGTDDRVGLRGHDRHLGHLIRDHRKHQRVGQFRWQRGGATTWCSRCKPAPPAIPVKRNHRRNRSARGGCREADGVASIGEHRLARAAAEHGRHAHTRAARYAKRRDRLHRFIGAAEIRGIVGEE